MMFTRQSKIVLLPLVVFLFVQSIGAFQTSSRALWQSGKQMGSFSSHEQKVFSTRLASTRAQQSKETEETSFLMKPFSTASGEIVNPYKILKVPRSAERKEIREAYRKLSKQYHPDIVRHRDVLPGKCNNNDDIEAEWERIQISYNILSEKKTRMQYDRHEVIADPGAAMTRAVAGAAVAGIVGMGKGIFHIGSSALDHMIGEKEEKQ